MTETLKDEIIKKLNESRKLSDSTLKTYTSLLVNLLHKLNSNDIKAFDDVNKVMDFIKKLTNAQTQKTILSSLYVLTSKPEYKNEMVQYSDIVNKNYSEKRTKSDRLESGISSDKIKQIYNTLKEKVKANPTNENLNMDFIIVCLTSGLFIPPRRNIDWCLMKIRGQINKTNDNYMTKDSFIFNQFKTSKYVDDKDREITIPKTLKTLINKWKKLNTESEYLLYSKNGPFTSSAFSKRLNKIYGHKVGIDTIRSIYLTSNFGDVAKAMQKMNQVTKQMGSSTNSALQYYIKDDQK